MLTEDAGIRPRQFAQLAITVDKPEDLWTTPPEVLGVSGGLTAGQTRKLARAQKQQAKIVARVDALVAGGLDVVTCFDESYYPRLLKLTDPPPRLYRKGQEGTASRYLFVTGTLDDDALLIGLAAEAGKALATLGLGLVSTLHPGIEAGAHIGALSQEGAHLVFLPGGHNRIDPPEHVTLCEEISGTGALVSEHAPDYAAEEKSRTHSSRLAVALSHGVFIVGWDPDSPYTRRILSQAALEGTPVFYMTDGEEAGQEMLRSAGAYPVADVQALNLILQYL
jgi:DNA processing protein